MRRALALAALVCALVPADALADGDPASDVLIEQRIFWPYVVKLPAESRKALDETVAEATKKGFPVRVALIQNDFDLGSAAVLYRHPQDYSKFLAEELANFNSDWLLVVMPNGYGIYNCLPLQRAEGYSDPCERHEPTAADERLLRSLPAQERSGQDIAAAADVAVRELAALHGVKVGGPPILVIAGVGVVVAGLLAGGFFVLRRRRARVA